MEDNKMIKILEMNLLVAIATTFLAMKYGEIALLEALIADLFSPALLFYFWWRNRRLAPAMIRRSALRQKLAASKHEKRK